MANLYITEQRSILRKTGDRLIVEKDDQVLLDVQCRKVEAVLIFGNVQFTTQAVHELFEHGIELAVLTRNGRLVGQLTSPATKNISLRLRQFRQYENPAFRLQLSKAVVRAKIANGLNFIKRFASNHPEVDTGGDIRKLQRYMDGTDSADGIETLMGIEGSAARDYFAVFKRMLLSPLGFPGRRKRPPTDPVNSMLSLGYTMLFNEIASLLDGLGFDPYLGFFHSPDYGRASLAADLMEEFRAPVVDHLTLNLVNLGVFRAEDFHPNPRGGAVYFRREALKRYFDQYERFLNQEFQCPSSGRGTTFRKCFRQQAEALARTLDDPVEVPYRPFQLEV